MRLGERAAEDGEVLGEDVDEPAVDAAGAGDDAVTGIYLLLEAEGGGAVSDEAVELDEAAGVEEQIQPLAGGELALLVLLGHSLGASSLLGEGLAVVELVEPLLLRSQFELSLDNPLRSILSMIFRAPVSSPPFASVCTMKRSPTSTVSSLRLLFLSHSS